MNLNYSGLSGGVLGVMDEGSALDPAMAQDHSHIWIVQGPAKPEITAIREALAALPVDKSHLYPANRVNFWFEGPHKAIKKLEEHLHIQIPVIMPWEIPTGYEGDHLDPDLDRIARTQGIIFVPVPKNVMAGTKRFDNFYTKPHAHGAKFSGTFNPDDFRNFQRFACIMARAVDDYIAQEGLDGRRTIINVQNKYLLGVPQVLRQLDNTKDSTILYFSHIPLVATSKPDSFDKVDPAVKQVYAASLACCDAVNCHTDEQASVFARFAGRTLDGVDYDSERKALVHETGHETQLGSIFLGIDLKKWDDIIRGETAWKVAAEAMKQMDGRQSATMFGRLDVFKGLDVIPQVVDKLLEKYPEFRDNFVFTNIYGRVNPGAKDGNDPFSQQLRQIQETTQAIDDKLTHGDMALKQSPFLKFELTNSDGTKREFLNQEELGGVMIATMLNRGVVPVTSTEEGLHMGVFEFLTACSHYLLDNRDAFRANCVKYLGMQADDPRIEDASVVAWVSRNSGAAHYLVEKADKAALLMHPSDVEASADTLARALKTSTPERLDMLRRARDFMRSNTPAGWVQRQFAQGVEHLQARLANDNDLVAAPAAYCLPTRELVGNPALRTAQGAPALEKA